MIEIHRITGYILNPNDKVVNSILKRIEKCDGKCPCSHPEWTENVTDEDKKCPCITYRYKRGCHCGLYLKVCD